MSNGPSTSSCNSHHDNEKNRAALLGNMVGNMLRKGPYIYELFSIMIHSGSASGGHYYAYIKDFRTQQWLCFNDQSVTRVREAVPQKKFYFQCTDVTTLCVIVGFFFFPLRCFR